MSGIQIRELTVASDKGEFTIRRATAAESAGVSRFTSAPDLFRVDAKPRRAAAQIFEFDLSHSTRAINTKSAEALYTALTGRPARAGDAEAIRESLLLIDTEFAAIPGH